MNNKNSTYKRLGDYIREINVRNKDLSVTKLMGINIDKYFMPSVANVIGTDMSNYKVVANGQFACNLMHVGRDEKIPVALNTEDPIIVSPAYFVFEVCDNTLLPEYLELSLRNPEFDRNAWFHTDGDVRGGMDKEGMKDLLIPVPPLEEQRSIVNRYKAIENRIANNKQTIAKLEEAAQALYRKMFVDDIDVENLPEGWRMGRIKEFCKEIKSGGTPSRTNNSYWDSKYIPWLKSGEVHNNIIWNTEDYISESGLKNSSAKLIPADSVIMAMYGATAAQVAYLKCETTTNQACCNMICHSKEDAAFLYFHLRFSQEEIKRLANGGAQENLSQELIANLPILLVDEDKLKQPFEILLNQLSVIHKEVINLIKIKEFLLI